MWWRHSLHTFSFTYYDIGYLTGIADSRQTEVSGSARRAVDVTTQFPADDTRGVVSRDFIHSLNVVCWNIFILHRNWPRTDMVMRRAKKWWVNNKIPTFTAVPVDNPPYGVIWREDYFCDVGRSRQSDLLCVIRCSQQDNKPRPHAVNRLQPASRELNRFLWLLPLEATRSAVLPRQVVCPSEVSWSYRLEFCDNNFTLD